MKRKPKPIPAPAERPRCLTCGGVLRSGEEVAALRCWLCSLVAKPAAPSASGRGENGAG